MKQWMTAVLAAGLMLTLGSGVWAATPPQSSTTYKPAALTYTPLSLQGKVVAVGKGWVTLEIAKILSRGTMLKSGEKVRVYESSRVKIFRNGKTAPVSALQVGETVTLTGSVVHRGTQIVSYRATTMRIMQ